MQLINLNEIDINKTILPEEEYSCFIICKEVISCPELLEKIIRSNAKEINFYGMWHDIWEDDAEKIIDKGDIKGIKSIYSNNLGDFIRFLEIESHKEAVLFYDDDSVKNYVLKRINEISNNKELDLERIELNAHSRYTDNLGISTPEEMIIEAINQGLDGIVISDYYSTNAYYEIQKISDNPEYNIRTLYGVELYLKENSLVNVICQNDEGKKELYKILTKYHQTNNKYIINEKRKSLLIGASCLNDCVFKLALNKDYEELSNELKYYDFIEVAPVNSYHLKYKDINNEDIKDVIRTLIKEAKKLAIPVIATSMPYYAIDDDYLEFSVLYDYNKPNNKLYEDIKLHIYSTEELRYEFDFLNDDELVKDIVINNTHLVLNRCQEYKPFKAEYHSPYIPNAYDKVYKLVYDRVHELYGNDLDEFISKRLNNELEIIKDNNHAPIYYLVSEICKKCSYNLHSVRGSAGNSFVAYLLGISKCNPLPAHRICHKCHKLVWLNNSDGFNVEDDLCECGNKAISDGHNLYHEVFTGIKAIKLPDFDLNLPYALDEGALDSFNKIDSNNKVIRIGMNECIGYKKAKEIVDDFMEEDDPITNNLKEDMIEVIKKVVVKQDINKYACLIVPTNIDIEEYTPLNITKEAKIETYTCYDYSSLCDYFYPLHIIKQEAVVSDDLLRDMNMTIDDIDIRDPEIYKLINGEKDYGLLGVQGFDNRFELELINELKPKNFEELVKIYGLAHGTNAWNNNQDELSKQGLPLSKMIATRDDLLDVLLEYGMDMAEAYKIMNHVSKGKELTNEQVSLLQEHNIKDSTIKVIQRIKYLFPRAHAIPYVTNALRNIWLKIYKPAYFYVGCLNRDKGLEHKFMNMRLVEINKLLSEALINNIQNEDYLRSLLLAKEMKDRGINYKIVNDIDNDIYLLKVNPKDENEILCVFYFRT